MAAKYTMTEEGGVWVGLLDMDDVSPVVGVSGPVSVRYRQARVLIRRHQAPLGHVSVPMLARRDVDNASPNSGRDDFG